MSGVELNQQKERSPAYSYLVALIAPAIVAGVMQLTWPFFEQSPVSLFLLAVSFCAWYGGLGPGLLSVLVSFLFVDYLFVTPYFAFWTLTHGDLVNLVILVTVGPFISVLSELMHRQKRRAEINLNTLRIIQERYRKLAENFPNGAVTTYDQDLRVTFIAGKGLEEAGVSPDFFIGKSLDQIAPPEVVAIAEPYFRAAFEGHVGACEWPYPDGRSYFATVAPLPNGNGRINEILVISQNITERKRAEGDLRKQKEILQTIFDHIPIMISFYDKDGIKLINREWQRTRGWSREDIRDQRVDILAEAHPDPHELQRAKDFIAAGSGEWADFKMRVKDGRVLDTSWACLRLSDGTRINIGQDITERKLAEERLREYEKVVEGLDDMIVVIDRDYRYLIANRAFLYYRDLNRDQVIGHLVSEFQDPVIFEQIVKPKLDECFEGKVVTYEFKYSYPKLGERDLFLSYFPIEGPGGVDQAACIIRDVTEQKRSEKALREAEQKYRDIFENAGEGIFQSTPEGQYVDANPALARMHGLDTPEELIRRFKDISREVYVDPAQRQEFKDLIEAQGFVRGFEHQIFRRDGSKIWVSVNARGVRDEHGEIRYYEGTVQDISERKLAEARSAAFATLARKLSGASTQIETGRIIAETARELFDWDSCNLDLYDADNDLVHPILNVDTIAGQQVDITADCVDRKPTARGRRVIDHGPELLLREEPIQFDNDTIPFGDMLRPSASLMSVPIRHATKIVGLLSIQSYTPRAYNAAALNDLQSLADYCGEALNRIHAEESFFESEERYRDLVENSRELICTHDLNGLILSANTAAAENLGYDLNDFVGKKNIRDILAPSVRHQFADYMAKLLEAGATSGTMIVQTSSGERRLLEFYNSLRTVGVSSPVVRGMARDITERRRAEKALRDSEERYRELFENAKDAIYVHDLSGRYTSLNLAAEKLTGYSRDEIIGKHFSNFVAPRDLKYVRKNLCKKLDAEGETTYEVDIVTKDRRRVPVEIISRLIYENGQPIGVQGTARDITERKRAQEALQVYSRRLIEAQEAERQSLARELHDEIGQVLTAVRINLQTVQSSCQNDAALPHVEESIVIVDEALGRIGDLSLELRPSLLDDLGLASALRWYVDRYGQRTGIVAEVLCGFEGRGRLPRELETECFRIAQEALTNVARHAHATRVSVQLEGGVEKLLLIITDNGIGFDTERLFQTASSASTLGLRGMQERALAMNGHTEINSSPGKGTQIRATFPLKRSNPIR